MKVYCEECKKEWECKRDFCPLAKEQDYKCLCLKHELEYFKSKFNFKDNDELIRVFLQQNEFCQVTEDEVKKWLLVSEISK